jgi:hypothetical protein
MPIHLILCDLIAILTNLIITLFDIVCDSYENLI